MVGPTVIDLVAIICYLHIMNILALICVLLYVYILTQLGLFVVCRDQEIFQGLRPPPRLI